VPFVYTTMTKAVADSFSTSGTANTEIDALFLSPGVRNIGISLLQVLGRGAGLTALSGIAYHFKRWTSTASSGGTSITPGPKDPGAQGAKASAGGASAGVTSGTGGPTLCGLAGSGAAGPGAWAARDQDSMIMVQGSATQSADLFVESGTTSLNYEAAIEHYE
jgi:hypothetical protein